MKYFDDKDSFWSIDSMLPAGAKNTEKKADRGFASDTGTVEFEIEGTERAAGERIPQRREIKYPPITAGARDGEKIDFERWLKEREKYRREKEFGSKKNVFEYVPDNPFIKKVIIASERVYRPVRERFLTDGAALFAENGDFDGNVEFESIYPQYAQLNGSQKKCYVGFRSLARRGFFPEVSPAYIYLYLYELINLTEMLSPEERALKIAELICGYSGCETGMFTDMCNWLSDLCLIYELEIPDVIFGEVYQRVLKCAQLKEVYAKPYDRDGASGAFELMLAAGKYDYRKSRFYAEFAEYYDKYIEAAVRYALSGESGAGGKLADSESESCLLTHESFFRAYKTVNSNKTISVECMCVTRSEALKRTVSELTKYAENCLRSLLSVRQRLTVTNLASDKKNLIKKYFLENVKISGLKRNPSGKTVKSEEIPEYEKLYEPRKEKFTFESAAEIEKRSWNVTEKLVNAFATGIRENGISGTPSVFPSLAPEAGSGEIRSLSEEKTETSVSEVPGNASGENDMLKSVCIAGLKCIYEKNQADFVRLAKKYNMLNDAYMEKINGYLQDEIGDNAVECRDGVYFISEWYLEEVKELIEKNG